MSHRHHATRLFRLVGAVAILPALAVPTARAHAASSPRVSTAAVPTPTSWFNFDSDLTDSRSVSTATASASCPAATTDPCVSADSFGTDNDGGYWTWTSTQKAGGGFKLTTNSPVAGSYTLAVKFALSDLAAGRSNYSKIMDFEGRDSDGGVYFQFGRVQIFPGGNISDTLYTADTPLTLVVKRVSTGARSGDITLYMVGANKSLTKLYTFADAGGATLAAASGSGSQFGFFYDDVVTAGFSGEASPSGRVYDLKLWSGTVLTDAQISEAVLPPPAPTNTLTTAGDAQASVQWTGNARATSYVAATSAGGFSCTATAPSTSCTIAGLSNGTLYAVSVVAIDARGASAPSAASLVIPATTPSAPTSLSVTNGNGRAQIVFAPGFNGGRSISNYQYRLDGGSWTAFSPVDNTSPVTIRGLTNGVTYSVELRAVSSIGPGDASSAVNADPYVAPVPPEEPTNIVATPGDQSVSVAFTPGAVSGSTIANYEYSDDGGLTWTALSPVDTTSPITIPGLTNGTAYAFLIRAVSAASVNGDPSGVVTVTPRTTPLAPAAVTAASGDRQGRISFTAPDNGGSTISKYQYSVDGGAWKDFPSSPKSTSQVLSNLSNGTSYSVRVRAVNAAGNGPASNAVTIRPTGRPTSPEILDISPDVNKITVTIRRASSSGSQITSYQYSVDGGATWSFVDSVSARSTFVVTNLSDGEYLQVMVRAVNANGTGLPSDIVTTLVGSSLPRTGGESSRLMALSVALLVVGLALALSGRLRKSRLI